ncbi:MAG: hypothetical protein R2851_12350 [Caldilineaceae bacterium]
MTQQTGFVTNPAAAAARGRAAWNESFAPVLSELRDVLGKRTPERIAILSGVEWHAGTSEFRFHWLQTPYRITWPALVAFPADDSTPCPANTQGLFLYYLATARRHASGPALDRVPRTARRLALPAGVPGLHRPCAGAATGR